MADIPIDRDKLKAPAEVSGWGGGKQDSSDIARTGEKNPEFLRKDEDEHPGVDVAEPWSAPESGQP